MKKTKQEHFHDFVEKNADALEALEEKLGSYEAVGVYLREVIDQGKQEYSLTVPEVAEFLSVTPRRVRVLLSQGRIDGVKDVIDGTWRIKIPLTVIPSTRGPDLQGYPARKLLPRKVKIVKQEEA